MKHQEVQTMTSLTHFCDTFLLVCLLEPVEPGVLDLIKLKNMQAWDPRALYHKLQCYRLHHMRVMLCF